MKIGMFPSAFYPAVGGVEEVTRQSCHAHQAAGHEVMVVVNRWPRSLLAYEEYEGIPVHRLPLRVPTNRIKPKVSYYLTRQRIARQINRLLREAKADLLHVQCVSCQTEYALQAKHELGLPLVVTLHGELSMDASGIYRQPGLAQDRLQRLLQEADGITACSRQTMAEAEDFFGEPFGDLGDGGRGRVIHNGIDSREFEGVQPYQHARPYVFAIGRHVREKGFDVLVHAMQQVPESHDLLLAGDGREHDSLRALVSGLGLSERVKILGSVKHREAIRLFKGAELFVLPSRHEPFGIVTLEAMAAGTPVVGTRVGGVPEFVEDQVNGLLVEPAQTEVLSEAITKVLSDPEAAGRFAAGGLKTAKNFNWQTISGSYREVYQMVAAPSESSSKPAKSTNSLSRSCSVQ